MNAVSELERPVEEAVAAVMTIERDVLLTSVRHVASAIESRTTMPILANVMIAADRGAVRFTATDLDNLFEIAASCDNTAPMATTVHAGKLTSVVDTMRPGPIVISVADGWMILKQKGSTRKLPVIPSDQFPLITLGDEVCTFTMPAADLLGMMETVTGFASTDDKQYYLAGAFLHIADDRLAAAATDGNAVAECLTGVPARADAMPDIIVPTKAVNLLRRILGDPGKDEQIGISVTAGKIRVIRGSAVLVAKLVEGSFPNYRRIIPQQSENCLTVHAAEFERCIRAGGAIADGKTRGVRMDLSGEGCVISALAQDGSRASEPVEGDYRGEPLTLGLNVAYSLQTAKAFGSACTLQFHFQDARRHILVRSDARPGITVVLMPMNA